MKRAFFDVDNIQKSAPFGALFKISLFLYIGFFYFADIKAVQVVVGHALVGAVLDFLGQMGSVKLMVVELFEHQNGFGLGIGRKACFGTEGGKAAFCHFIHIPSGHGAHGRQLLAAAPGIKKGHCKP